MTPSKLSLSHHLAVLSFFVGLLGFVFPSQSAAQNTPTIEGLQIEISKPGGKDLPLALPRPKGNSASVDTLWKLVESDMQMSGYFRILNADGFLESKQAGIKPGSFDYSDWKTSNATVLAKTRLDTLSTGQLEVTLYVYDVPGKDKLLGRSFKFEPQHLLQAGHKVSNLIIEAVTGEPGIFNTRFAAVSRSTGNKEIVVFDVDGQNLRSITRNGSINLQPAWSKDGSLLAYTSYRRGNPDLYVADLRRGKTRPASTQEGINSGATFHPTADLIALTLSNRGNSDIYTMSTTGANRKRLTRSSGIDVSPSWSPDGSQIAFASERSGGVQIYIMNADGSNVRRLTFDGTHNTDPAWSPKGDRIAYVSRDGRYDVFTINPDGSGRLRITEDMGNNEDPTWSPDGNYLAFSSTRTGRSQIWMSTADNTHQIQLTHSRGGYTNPAWSPPAW